MKFAAARRGFSLIEILIAIIILALGLLGIGAVFPVVIREQKQSQDRIFSTLAEANVRAILRGHDELNKPVEYLPAPDAMDLDDPVLTARVTGWEVLKEDWNYQFAIADNPFPNLAPELITPPAFNFSPTGEWEVFWGDWNDSTASNAAQTYSDTGRIVFVNNPISDAANAMEFPPAEVSSRRDALLLNGATSTTIGLFREFPKFSIPLSARLSAMGGSSDDDPSYVWDMVARRKLETTDPRALQVAVFLRRVDPRLRPIPRAAPTAGNELYSIKELLLNESLPVAVKRLPVGEDTTGLPTLDGSDGAGNASYSPIHRIGAYFVDDQDNPFFRKRDRLFIDNSNLPNANEVNNAQLLAQIGQKCIDNLGNVYTVIEALRAPPGSGYYLRVDPPVPTAVLDTATTRPRQLGDPLPPRITQLIFTPQIPAAAFVVEIEP